jgi:lipid A 3-O-deacylase
MRPWKAIAFLLFILFTLRIQAAPLNMTGTTFTFGYWDEDTDRTGVRVAPRWDWGVHWLPNWPIQLTGYWEVGAWFVANNKTRTGQNSHLYIFSGSPILQIWLGPYDMLRNAVFFEIGVGPAYLTENSLGDANLGSHWQFEDKFGVGFNLGTERPAQFIYRYYHYSNAGFKEPNRGLDLHSFAVVWFF